jgi:hypothetical protein
MGEGFLFTAIYTKKGFGYGHCFCNPALKVFNK